MRPPLAILNPVGVALRALTPQALPDAWVVLLYSADEMVAARYVIERKPGAWRVFSDHVETTLVADFLGIGASIRLRRYEVVDQESGEIWYRGRWEPTITVHRGDTLVIRADLAGALKLAQH